jgi:hypothetical protein
MTYPDPPPYELDWYACDLLSGGIIEELKSLRPTQPLSRRLGTVTTARFSLHLEGAPDGWEACTAPWRTLLVAVDSATDTPLWAGIILTREGGSTDTLEIGAATPEHYFDRRYVTDHALVQQDQADVITALVSEALTLGPPFVMDAPDTGVLMNFSVLDSDDKTVLSAMQQVMAVDGGPEWTVDVAWTVDRAGFTLPVRVRPKIGTQLADPESVFDLPGCISEYSIHESYEIGRGATVTVARGEGEGTSRLTSADQIATDLEATGWPRGVYRWTPSSGITDLTQLDAHAARALTLMRAGAVVWSVDAAASRAPRLGIDWALGDTIRIAIEDSPRHPAGADLVARVWAWELDPSADVLSPVLVEED